MTFRLIFLAALLVAVACDCDPFGLRLYYGDILTDPSSSSLAVVYFNTRQ